MTTKLPIVSFHQMPFKFFLKYKLSEFYSEINDELCFKFVAELGEPKNLLQLVTEAHKNQNIPDIDKQQFVFAVGPEGGWYINKFLFIILVF
jgi:16S rRNA U1498 N3-methylase RsmE